MIVHPGPPGDAGPSSLDWVLLGDTGTEADSDVVLSRLLTSPMAEWTAMEKQRSHWGIIVFQANEHLDGGSVWAWEQYALPEIGTITKAQLYQGQHSIAATSALIIALLRVYETVAHTEPSTWLGAVPETDWSENSVTHGVPFLGGVTHERPLLQSNKRKPSFSIHTAQDVLRIVNAGDSQPGAQLGPLTTTSKSSLFVYGAHIHLDSATVPPHLYQAMGFATYDDIPDGRIIALRSGSVFMKTRSPGAGVWITHGRIPKKAGSPLEPKIPMVKAVRDAGHGAVVENVQEWPQEVYREIPGTWQQVYVRTENSARLVYWGF